MLVKALSERPGIAEHLSKVQQERRYGFFLFLFLEGFLLLLFFFLVLNQFVLSFFHSFILSFILFFSPFFFLFLPFEGMRRTACRGWRRTSLPGADQIISSTRYCLCFFFPPLSFSNADVSLLQVSQEQQRLQSMVDRVKQEAAGQERLVELKSRLAHEVCYCRFDFLFFFCFFFC
jgi:hypothetical protein